MKLISTLETEKALLLRKLPTLNLAQNRLAQKKIKQIDDEIAAIKKSGIPTLDDMHALADSLGTLALAIESDKPVAPEQPAKPELSLSDVRAVLAKKSQAGFTKEIKALIEKYGAEKLSAVEPKHYEALLKEVEGLKK